MADGKNQHALPASAVIVALTPPVLLLTTPSGVEVLTATALILLALPPLICLRFTPAPFVVLPLSAALFLPCPLDNNAK